MNLNHLTEEEVSDIEIKENEIVLQIMKNRRVIEDCFRLLKQEFNFHPVNHSLEDRIKAHFMTCVMSLLCFKYIKNILKDSQESIFKERVKLAIDPIMIPPTPTLIPTVVVKLKAFEADSFSSELEDSSSGALIKPLEILISLYSPVS